jgi:flagellar hook-associated protein 1
VSLDEEAASMMRFQRAYEANARFFTVVNETLDVLLNLGR